MRKFPQIFHVIFILILFIISTLSAQYAVREDAIWARTTNETITLDGLLNESSWNSAEALHIRYGADNGLPTSGYKPELIPTSGDFDSTDAMVKFIVNGNYLYVAVEANDVSVGGKGWARHDGILMSIKPVAGNAEPWNDNKEIFYAWMDTGDSLASPPKFAGTWGGGYSTERPAAYVNVWDAGYSVINGVSNDSLPDDGYVFEIGINLDSLFYDATNPAGEEIMLNFSIWDADYVFQTANPLKTSATYSFWQNQWNNSDHNVGRVYVRPDVTVNSGPVPDVEPDVIIQSAGSLPAPTIDGVLDEQVWALTDSFFIAFDDSLIRSSYPGVMKYRSGQWQPEVGFNPRPPVLDPAFAIIRVFFKDDFLYMSADVNDLVVAGESEFDRMDGVRFVIGDRNELDVSESRMVFKELTVYFNSLGVADTLDDLVSLALAGGAELAVSLKGTTTVNVHTDIDEGYIVEMKVDLTYLHYPSGLGDGLLFGGVMVMDGDRMDDPLNDYGSRTWWAKESRWKTVTPWMVMDPNITVGIDDKGQTTQIPNKIELHGNYPNPFNPGTNIKYSIPFTGEVQISIYNILGQEIENFNLGKKSAGLHTYEFKGNLLSSGIYFYRFELKNSNKSDILTSSTAKMILIK